MKYICLVSVFLVLVIGCQPAQDVAADKVAIETVMQDFFAAITKYDSEALRKQCAADFVLIEHGLWRNADSLINLMKGFEGKATMKYTFDDIKSTVEGSVGWMTYNNHGLMTMGDKQAKYEWAESAVFKKQNGTWKMALLHSTRTSPM